MSDNRNDPLTGIDDTDWDIALDEWEKNSFAPAVGEPTPSSALPPVPPAPPVPTAITSEAAMEETLEGTRIAPVPRELREGLRPAHASSGSTAPPRATLRPPRVSAPPTRASVSPSGRGGLDQLFSRPPPRPPGAKDTPTRPRLPVTKAPFERPNAVPPAGSWSAPSVSTPEDSEEGEATLVWPSPLDNASNAKTAERPVVKLDEPDHDSFADADTATRLPAPRWRTDERRPNDDERLSADDEQLPAEDERPTMGRPPSPAIPAALPSSPPQTARGLSAFPPGPTTLESARSFEGERPAASWLDEAKAQAFAARIAWLEDEARAAAGPTERGRALLALSELCAVVGEKERAHDFAIEARDLAPAMPLAWRQARQLMPRDPARLVEVLDAEAARAATPSARAHATLLAADVLRVGDRADAAVERWDRACKLDPADARAPIARAARALAEDDPTNGALHLAGNSELIALDKAVATALRLRGIERPGVDVEETPINDGLRRARLALASGDVVTAAQSIGAIAALPELAKGAHWLSAALGAAHTASRRDAARALKKLASDGDVLARRQLAALGVELGDPELVSAALSDKAAFEPAERAVLDVLAASQRGDVAVDPETLGRLADDGALAPLVDALAALSPVASGDDGGLSGVARARRVAGKGEARALATLGRLLAANATTEAVDDALAALAAPRPASADGVAIEAAVRGERWDELSEALASLPATDEVGAAQRRVAAAIVAERAGNRERAQTMWGEVAKGRVFATDSVLRIAADLDRGIDLGAQLLRVADEMPDGVAAAIVRLEGLARTQPADDERAELLERVHRARPELGIAGFLGARLGRRRGAPDEVLRWLHERRAYATDPLETALDGVREALLLADRDRELAAVRLEEAHHARPDDVALRELYERLAPEPPSDRGAWRERRAEAASGPSAAPLWMAAALDYDRSGDAAAARRAAQRAAEAGDRGLSRLRSERAEIAVGDVTRQTTELLELAKTSEDAIVRREAFERLADIDAFVKEDASAAILWHRSILEEAPQHAPSLRWLEHALIGEGRDGELAPIFEAIALALDGVSGGEAAAHAQHAARLRARDAQADVVGPSAWERTHTMTRLAATQPSPSLWALRALNTHARAQRDDTSLLETTLALLERTQRPAERAALLLRASEAAARMDQIADTLTYLEQAASEDPGDVVTWGLLAEVRERAGEARMAAEAYESLARTSAVREHQRVAWHDAAEIWLDEVHDIERGMNALEAAAESDATYADVFPRLFSLYTDKGLDAERARLLERRLDVTDDEDERVTLEIELARAFAEMGELPKAKGRLQSALDKRPDHTAALGAMAELCVKEGDWSGTEQAYVRLARLLSDPAEQRAIYEHLGEIYSVHAPNLSRAAIALREVLKRSPGDRAVLEKLVDVYTRQGDAQKAAETQQELVAAETDADERLARLLELAAIHETVGHDPRRSEQVFESARKEFPTSVVALRAMAEFYARQHQMPAMQILLDRAASDARRAFAQGRFVPALFEVLHVAFELRGKRDAARVVAATMAAASGRPSDLMGADARAVEPHLDDLLAPETMSPALRALLFRAGDALDAVAPLDLRALKATPLHPGTPIGATVGSVATFIGLGALQILVSPELDRVALPLAIDPPTLLVGEGLAKVTNERARMFVVVRAMKMLLARASFTLRGRPEDVSELVAGLFGAFNPNHVPQGVDLARVADLARRIVPALPRDLDPTVGVIALEAAGMLGTRWSSLAPAAYTWANRVALLAVGDPNAALDALAWGHDEDAAPTAPEERAAWLACHADARDLLTFSVTDAYAEARARLELDR